MGFSQYETGVAWMTPFMDKRKFGLKLLHRLQIHKAIGSPTLGCGVIFSAHRVQPARGVSFQPNRNLTITPEFLEAVVLHVRKLGFQTLSLDDAHQQLLGSENSSARQPFVCFTFDDGYRDNRQWAYPVLAKHKVPFTVFVPTRFADGSGVLWWELLERIIVGNEKISSDGMAPVPSVSTGQKQQAFSELVGLITRMTPPAAHGFIVRLAERHGIDSDALCRDLILNWDELAEFSRRPFVNIGGHTINHYRLSRLTDDQVETELAESLATLESRLGQRPRHFSYPFGDPTSANTREYGIAHRLGLTTAVTTNNSIIGPQHRNSLTSLPRLSLNRMYEDLRCLEVLMSGVQSKLPTWLLKAG